MLFAPLSASADLALPDLQKPGVDAVLRAYEEAFRLCNALPERIGEDELAFRVPVVASQPLSLWVPDLGLVSQGSLVVTPNETGYRVQLRATPRSWMLLLGIVPWLLLIWGLGLTAAPWRYLLAFGGLPLYALLWIMTWANLSSFLDYANKKLVPVVAAGDPA